MFCSGSYPILPPPPVPPQVLSLLPQPTTDFCSRHTSRITFHISIILAGLMALIDCMIRFWSISVVIMTLDLQGQICYIISQQKLSTERKTIIWNAGPQILLSTFTLIMTLTSSFQGQILNLLYLVWSDCHETKNEHIDWTLSLKCGHQFIA